MASLIENLMTTLEAEIKEYEKLLDLSTKKTPVIIEGDFEKLTKITDDEQNVIDCIASLDSKRISVTKDIADVINKDVETLKLTTLIGILEKQPEEQSRLAKICDRLTSVVNNVRLINDNNRELINHSLEMVDFDLNLLRSMRQAPETNNYGADAINSGSFLGSAGGGFDAKQ